MKTRKTVAEIVGDFIDKNTAREREKWEAGMNNRYNAWDEFRESWVSGSLSNELKEYRSLCAKMRVYLKERGLEKEFKEWESLNK